MNSPSDSDLIVIVINYSVKTIISGGYITITIEIKMFYLKVGEFVFAFCVACFYSDIHIRQSRYWFLSHSTSLLIFEIATVLNIKARNIPFRFSLYLVSNYLLKGKRNAYFDFQNVGFIVRTNAVLIPAIYTHWYRRLNFSTNVFNFCWWRIPLAMTSLPRIVVHRLYVKETRARKQITIEENGSLNNFPP